MTAADDSLSMHRLRDELRIQELVPVRVRIVHRAPETGRLGGGPEFLSVLLGAGGTVPVLLAVVGRWLRRTANASVELESPSGARVRWSAELVRGLTAEQMNELIEQAARQLGVLDRPTMPGPDDDGTGSP